MRIRIVCYEDVNAWILGKFALNLEKQLTLLGHDVDIAKVVDEKADINHHIIYLGHDFTKGNKKDSLMITHIDDIRKLSLLKKQFNSVGLGICMSLPLMNELINGGIPAEKLCYINPAHDGVISIKPYTIGITSEVKPDGCKREHLLAELSEHISPKLFKFKIMGSGWEAVIQVLEKRGFQITYCPDFNYNEYIELIPSLDYYLYMGQDEGSMGYIDALAAGIKTIVTPQGYHLDAENGITHPFNTLSELIGIFNSIAQERMLLVNSVSKWTWRDYAIKHLEVWSYLNDPKQKNLNSLYKDGLKSLLNINYSQQSKSKLMYKINLYQGAWKRTIYKIRIGLNDFETFKTKSRSFIRNIMK